MENKPEFQLAIAIFVAMSIIGTGFGLWWASRLASVKPRTNVEASSETQPAPNSPPVAAAGGR